VKEFAVTRISDVVGIFFYGLDPVANY